MLVGEELWQYLKERGVTRHEHPNGLMGCVQCAYVVATGKTVEQLEKEHKEMCRRIGRDMGLSEEEMDEVLPSV